MPSLVATTPALALTTCSARTMFAPKRKRKNNAKFSGHYVRPHTHAQRSCACTPFAPIINYQNIRVPCGWLVGAWPLQIGLGPHLLLLLLLLLHILHLLHLFQLLQFLHLLHLLLRLLPVCGDENPPVGDKHPPVCGDEHPPVGDEHNGNRLKLT